MTKKVAIIGGGLGGISAALYLSNKVSNQKGNSQKVNHQKYEIEIFEKNDKLGGKLNYLNEMGYYFDIGPSLLTMPFVIEDIFQYLDKKIEDYLDIDPLENICRYFWSDNTILDANSDLSKFKENINLINKNDSENLSRFLDYSKQIYDLTADTFLFGPFLEWSELTKFNNYKTLLNLSKIDTNRTMQEAIDSYFESSKLRQLFGRYATYNGSNPYKAPATLNIIPHVEYTLGSYYIKGGMYKLGQALEKLLSEQNIKINYNSTVKSILTQNNTAIGIEISDAENEVEKRNFDIIISNSDVVYTNDKLINSPKLKKDYNKYEPSLSGFVMTLGINKIHDNLNHHNILFSDDYQREFKQIFEDLEIPDDPTIYISITNKSDKSHAPIGAENWFILLNMPYTSYKINWSEKKAKVREIVLNKLKRFGFDITDNIEFEKIYTPEDLENMYFTNRGSIYGLSSNDKFSAFLRQSNRNKKVKNLYHCGGSVHPGGGIPLVLLSGKITSELVRKYS